ncbi:hypothetical protein LTR53_011165 [Teratosphaeriaceae sp. CCFEE 6253]|nr:hypothetical protein LTR53_011165 [Teratosphaeriaceae sp. CCFEE 6253]
MLKNMVERGKAFRKAVDELEGGVKKVVGGAVAAEESVKVGRPAVAGDSEEKIESVDGYMKWLYGEGR